MSIYYTPLGVEITEDELEEQERFVCPDCGFAILEDEGGPCPKCGLQTCMYCYEDGTHQCDKPRPAGWPQMSDGHRGDGTGEREDK